MHFLLDKLKKKWYNVNEKRKKTQQRGIMKKKKNGIYMVILFYFNWDGFSPRGVPYYCGYPGSVPYFLRGAVWDR